MGCSPPPPPDRNGWSAQHAWRITQLLDRELREMQATGWRLSSKYDARFESLLKQRRKASETHNMPAYVHVHREILQLARDDFARQRRCPDCLGR